jgi:diguanylate cyclase (GGDEF)-like protein/PAS domain S-box-containing protein
MGNSSFEFAEMHWLMDVLQSIDVGLVILDRDYKIQLWNSFMENHSGLRPDQVHDKSLFDSFHDIPENWFRQKAEPVFELKTRTFTIWEQRPYLFKFKNYRPITGRASTMYQNSSMIPLESIDGSVNHICLIIYDVTDIAVNQEDLTKANGHLAYLSQTDSLTELFNRGFWEDEFKREHKRCSRSQQPSCLVMFDIDHFKNVNDQYGHQAGDEVIRTLASMVRQTARETDICGRYGGEEFAILLVDTDSAAATHFTERLRKKVAELTVKTDEHEIQFTISSGVAQYSSNFNKHTQWIEAADKALYHAKENGRNRTTVYQEK